MQYRGKIIGALTGLMFGPLGALFGLIIGHLYDIGYFRAFLQAAQGGVHTHAQQIFFNNTFKIMGYIAKSDGHISEREIQAARNVMAQMGLNALQKEQAIQLFTLGKQSDFNLHAAIFELKQIGRLQPALLQLFVDIQTQMVSADGNFSSAKRNTLENICVQLGLRDGNTQYQYQQYQQHSYYQRPPTQSNKMSRAEAFQILGVTENATRDEIKIAYRKLMSQNHPDKLIAKGLPPEMIKMATQKTQKIKEAYEILKG